MKRFAIEMKWAIFFVMMSLAWMAAERLAGLHNTHIDKHAIFTNLVAIPAVAIYILALLDKKRNYYRGHMTYRQGFASGLVITLIVTLFSPLTQYITSEFITPGYFPNAISYSVGKGAMTAEQAADFFNLKSYIMQALIGTPVMGLITSAVVAIFTKSKRNATASF